MKKTKMKATGLMLVLIIMLMTGLIYINNLNSVSSLSSNISSLELLEKVEAKEKESKITAIEDLMIEAAGAVVKAYDLEGKAAWSKTLAGKIEDMKSMEAKLFILDSSKKLYCISRDGKVAWEQQLEGSIRGYYIDRSGDVLIDYTYEQGTKLQIISSKGIDEGSMLLDNAYVLAYASGKEENTISVVDISSQAIKTKLLTLDLKGNLIWSDNYDNQIIAMLGYTKDNALIAIGEKAIYKYKNQSKTPSQLDLSRAILNSSISDSAIAVVLKGKNGYEVHTYDSGLNETGMLEQDNKPAGISLGKGNYLLYSNENLLLVDFKGKVKAELKSMFEIKKAYFGAEKSIFVISDRLLQKLSY